MKKVLIADDELLVRIGLKTTIPWEENGFLVVGEAKNGKEAMEFFEEYNPDILLTDVNMPVVSGLQLIKELKARKASLKAVILSHYDDFNYAREAIKLGASEYILKSDLTPDNLLEVLNRVSKDIDKSDGALRTEELLNDAADAQNDSKPSRNYDTLRSYILGKYVPKEELSSFLRRLGVVFKYDSFVVSTVALHMEDIRNENPENNSKHLSDTINNISERIFNNSGMYQFSFLEENKLIYLINLEKGQDYRSGIDRVMNLMSLVKRNLSQFLDLDAEIGLSDVSQSVEEIPALYIRSVSALRYCFFEKTAMYLFTDHLSIRKDCPQINLEFLRSHVKTVDGIQLNNYIDQIFHELYMLKSIDCLRDIFFDFLGYAKVISTELNLKSEPAFNEAKLSYSVFDKLRSFDSAKKYVLDIYDEMIANVGGNKSGKYSYITNKCIEYIKSSYKKNITLADAAEYVQISKSYLSLLFKQETGINFSNFLTGYRIEKSKKLIKETNYKIYEIAEKIGFDNPYYFSKVFKEITGITCKEYKRLNMQSSLGNE